MENSNSNSLDSELVSDELEISDNEITFKSNTESDEKEGEGAEDNKNDTFNISIESKCSDTDNVIKPIKLSKKRKKSDDWIADNSEEKETDTKKAKKDTEERDETNKVAFSNENKEDTVEPDLPWDPVKGSLAALELKSVFLRQINPNSNPERDIISL